VTCLTIHPAGHFFVAGYADGTIAFWAVEDEDHPLFVRTIDDLEEINIVDGDKIEQYLPSGNVAEKEPIPYTDREPVFKLSWSGFPNSSDPRGGETALTVLGGLMEGDRPGVTVLWLPPFNPPEAPVTAGALVQKSLHPSMRKAMRESILPLKSYFYATVGPTQDFLLLSRSSPHFAAAFDPVAIILLSDTVGDTRAVEAFQFPPPEFVSPVSAVSDNVLKEPSISGDRTEPSDPSDVLSEDLASTLRDMSVNDDPKRLNLAPSLWNGNSGVVHAEMLKLEHDAYETFTAESNIGDDELPLKGGIAWMNDAKATEAKLSKVGDIRHFSSHVLHFVHFAVPTS
jgi:syntaxin-binding protein 5